MRHSSIRLTAAVAFLSVALSASASQDTDCSAGPALQDDEILIAWLTDVRVSTPTRVGPFRALVLLKDARPVETDGSTLRNGMRFQPLLRNPSASVTLRSTASFLDRLGDDHCVYFADLRESGYKRFTLFSSRPVVGFRVPTAKESADFFRLNTTCVEQGDSPPNRAPPCVRPRLLAIRQGETLEYWATEPYMWDTGLTIWQRRGNELIALIRICVGCSD